MEEEAKNTQDEAKVVDFQSKLKSSQANAALAAAVAASGKASKEAGKIPYEQLEQLAKQLSAQNRELFQRLQQVSVENIFKRLDYLFRVVEHSVEFPESFVSDCITEIMTTMTLPKQDENPADAEEENQDNAAE